MTLNKAAIVPVEVKEALDDYGHDSIEFFKYETTGNLKAEIESESHITLSAYKLNDFEIFLMDTFSSGKVNISFRKRQ